MEDRHVEPCWNYLGLFSCVCMEASSDLVMGTCHGIFLRQCLSLKVEPMCFSRLSGW